MNSPLLFLGCDAVEVHVKFPVFPSRQTPFRGVPKKAHYLALKVLSHNIHLLVPIVVDFVFELHRTPNSVLSRAAPGTLGPD